MIEESKKNLLGVFRFYYNRGNGEGWKEVPRQIAGALSDAEKFAREYLEESGDLLRIDIYKNDLFDDPSETNIFTYISFIESIFKPINND